ncbi:MULTISPECIES: large conductance mechanosensitive channel protein MscL [Microbacterium]|uniref:large conductance mechanosensitive channel protein MscL n=1 Tax=Microbacterium TaxID=33882 RepID=UPI000D65A64C|nr:large conductance mechanosensitive channel protein MscL [Microbacterium sp. KCTC 39802]
MIKGFKEFILRGNVIDLAVAVVIGAAFTGIVNAIVTGLINPLIALIFQADSLNDIIIAVPNVRGGTTDFPIGLILGAIVNFLAVAVVVYFVFVYPMNRLKERAAAKAGITPADEEPKLPTEQELLVQIRDLLEAQGTAPRSPNL